MAWVSDMKRQEPGLLLRDEYLDKKEVLLETLLSLVKEEACLYESFQGILHEEKGRILAADMKGLNESGQFKEALMLKIRRLEAQRLVMIEDLAGILEVPCRGLTLCGLAQYVQDPYAARLKAARESLLALTGRIRRMNRFNKSLLRHALELIAGSYAFLSHLAAPSAVYQSSGRMQMRGQGGRIISNNI